VPTCHLNRRAAAAAAALATAALVVSGCGNGSSGNSASSGGGSSSTPTAALPSTAADQALAAQVPDAVKSDGVITVGTDSTYAPSEFLAEDGSTIIGFDVDLFTLVAQKRA
jgi:polar amino acid transport system substrate-binding protein